MFAALRTLGRIAKIGWTLARHDALIGADAYLPGWAARRLHGLRKAGASERPGERLAAALARFWYMRGYWHEGRDWLQQMTTLTAADTVAARRARAHRLREDHQALPPDRGAGAPRRPARSRASGRGAR